jgi:predicted esterase
MSLLLVALAPGPAWTAGPETGFQPERRVREATRLDWEFAAAPDATIPARYDSRQQRYQLFVPETYKETRSWPLVVFLSPGDDALGWRAWGKPCESGDWLFAAPYGAGSTRPLGQRVRAAVDVLDDVRQHYRIDPERTYLAGFSGGAALACRIAFALPEHFGGVIVLSGDAPLPALEHLRTRAAERLSVALLAGSADPGRAQQEKYLAPLYGDLGIRSRLWLVPKIGRELPPDRMLLDVQRWLDDDLKRRQTDRRERIGTEEETTRRAAAARALEQARKELGQPDHLQRGAARLQWIASRWARTEGGEKADELLAAVRADPRRGKALAAQAAASQKAFRTARARALEQVGRLQSAQQEWAAIARLTRDDERRKAEGEVKRLAGLLRIPYLGILFEGDTTALKGVVAGGPAHRAGLRTGDRLEQIDRVKVATPADVRKQIASRKPGDVLHVALLRAGKKTAADLTVGSPPEKEE